MRWLLTLGLVAALAGCSVDVEGAACPTPGLATGCPAGQACGTGGTCSEAAAACSPCAPGALACRDGDVKRCTPEGDPACGTWVVASACAAGTTTCGVPEGGPPECRCERHVADPAGAAASAACRFASAAAALAEARRFGVSEAWLGGVANQDYVGATSLVIPAGMTLAGDDTPLAPGSRVLEVGGAGVAAVELEAGASLAGVTIRRQAGGPATGVTLAAASPAGRASLTVVEIDAGGAGGPFATGVRVTGAGAVSLLEVAIRGATTAGLEVARAEAGDAVTAIDLLVDGEATASGEGVGVSLTTGDLTLRRPVVKRMSGVGVAATGAQATRRLTIEGGTLHHNLGTGLVAQLLGRLSVSGTVACRNKGGADRNLNGVLRKVGGVFLAGAVPAEQAFSGLKVFENDGDQLAIGLGSGTWNLAGPSGAGLACGTGVNAFAGYQAGSYGVVAAGNVDVSWDAWPDGLPVLDVDVLRILTPTVVLGTEGGASNYCSLPAGLTCPDP